MSPAFGAPGVFGSPGAPPCYTYIMAIITIGSPVTGIRGTLGGITYSANKYGPFCKQWAPPHKTTSPYQALVRSILPNYKVIWDALTPAQRAAWDTFAAAPNENDYNSLSQQYYLTGYQWHCRAQFRRALVGLATSATPPAGAAAPVPTGISIVPDFHTSGTCLIDWTDGFFGATDSCIVFISVGKTANLNYPNNNWKMLFAAYNPGNGGDDIAATVISRFGTPPLGWTLFADFYNQAAAGNRSTVARTSGEVT